MRNPTERLISIDLPKLLRKGTDQRPHVECPRRANRALFRSRANLTLAAVALFATQIYGKESLERRALMTNFVRCCALAVLVAVPTLTKAADAQTKVEVSATLGYYSPLGSFKPADQSPTFLPSNPGAMSGAAFGGELRAWMTSRIGAQVGATTTSTSFKFEGAMPDGAPVGGTLPINESVGPSQVRISSATAQILYQVLGNPSTARLWLSAGGAAVRHGGSAYARFGNPVNYGGALGFGSAFHITGPLSAELGLTTLIYQMKVTDPNEPGLNERGTQVDALFHTGVSYGWH